MTAATLDARLGRAPRDLSRDSRRLARRREVRTGLVGAPMPEGRPRVQANVRTGSRWAVALQNFERQLWSPNPTDFSLVAERRESALSCLWPSERRSTGPAPW